MKVAVIGSRNIGAYDLAELIPQSATCIISGGAKGIDSVAAGYARDHGLQLIELRPDYRRYGRCATFVRNRAIVEGADMVVAVWDGISRGTSYTVDYAKAHGVPVRLVLCR